MYSIALTLRLSPLITTFVLFAAAFNSSVHGQQIMEWDCRVESSNDGCRKTIKAPEGKKIVSVAAACNLEQGRVSDRELASVGSNKIKVVRASDRRRFRPRGYCFVGDTKIYSGEKTIVKVSGVSQVVVGCYEHDKNGGDCHIRGTATLEDGNADAAEKTYTLNLQRENIVQGNIPYTGRFPTSGQLPRGILKKVRSITGGYPALSFLKPGRSTNECNINDAIIRLSPGSELSSADIKTLFGSETPVLPVNFLACAAPTSQLYNWIPIVITYEERSP